jgi:hypothetical protein
MTFDSPIVAEGEAGEGAATADAPAGGDIGEGAEN